MAPVETGAVTVTKEAQLTSAVIMYALRSLQDGDLAALRGMNFGPAEVQALRELNMGDLCHLQSLRAHCLDIALNRDVYWPILAQLKQRRESEELQHALISADAPLEMMSTFFGISGREYSKLRHTLLVNGTTGRPPEPNDEEIEKIWASWRLRESQQEDGLLPPAEYLNIHKETGVPMRSIWRQTRMGLDFDG